MMNSIAGRLVLWVLVTTSTFFIGFEVFLYERQRETSMAMIDDGLSSKAEFLASMIEIFPDGSVHFEPAEHRDRYPTFYDSPGSGNYYRIVFDDGRLLARSLALGEFVFPIPPHAGATEPYVGTLVGPDGDPVRVYARRVSVQPLQTGTPPHTFVVETGESLREVERFLSLLRKTMVYSVPFIVLIAAIGGYLIARVSLRPLKRLSDEIGQISEQTLDRRVGEDRVSTELRDLAAAFNAMLGRIHTVFMQQRRFISDASHELRTPVSVIKISCEVPLRRDRTVEEYKQRLRTILRHTEKLSTLIGNLLTLSRLEHRSVPLTSERVDVNPLVGATVTSLTPLAKHKEIAVRCSLAPRTVITWGDETALTEVFTNLIENAIKYTGEGGRVTVTVETDATEGVVTVEDTGVGIPADALPQVFDRFYRADPARTAQPATGAGEHAGFGLGLSIVKELVEAHQGRITVASHVGKGSVFTVRLPIAP
jgi:heavy metal sensor kinase